MKRPKIYEIKNLYKKYKDKEVLLDINFSLFRGEKLAVLGKNGSGKTTLIKMLTGLLNPTCGEILYNGKNIDALSLNYYKDISIMLEGDRNIYWYMTGFENILYFSRLNGLDNKTIKNRADILLNEFDLYEHKDKKVGVYSRGMKQKLSLIIAFMINPKVIFLDEPTLGLDIFTKDKLIDIIDEKIKSDNMTVFLTSHELDVVEKICDRIMIIDEGQIKYIGSHREIIDKFDKHIYEIIYCGEIRLDSTFNVISHEKNRDFNILKIEESNLNVSNIIKSIETDNTNIQSIRKNKLTLEESIKKMWS